jgi:hypothetical protein
VESALGYTEAFFGLVASGWSLNDFAAPGAAARLPPPAQWAEHIVGLLDQERVRPTPWSAGDFIRALQATGAVRGLGDPPDITEERLAEIRDMRDDLTSRWHGLAAGATLEVEFPRPASCAPPSR